MKLKSQTKVQNFFARRLLRGDLPETILMSQNSNADYSYLTINTVNKLVLDGEGWCCTEHGEIVAVGGFLPLSANCELCEAVEKTRLLPPRSMLVLPVCAKPYFNGNGRFFEWCLSRASCKNEVLYALLPVKTGENMLQLYFSCGMCVVAMRPLYNLRPYYFFARGGMQVNRTNSIMVNVADTHTLSKFLENGYCAVDAYKVENELKMELVPYNI